MTDGLIVIAAPSLPLRLAVPPCLTRQAGGAPLGQIPAPLLMAMGTNTPATMGRQRLVILIVCLLIGCRRLVFWPPTLTTRERAGCRQETRQTCRWTSPRRSESAETKGPAEPVAGSPRGQGRDPSDVRWFR